MGVNIILSVNLPSDFLEGETIIIFALPRSIWVRKGNNRRRQPWART
jgi:hypothetical protein